MFAQYLVYLERWQQGEESGNRCDGRNLQVSSHVRRYLEEKLGVCCSKCGWAELNTTTGRVPINVEHIDGNPYNTVEGNLTFLCPNCHSLTPTYGNLNKGKGRSKGAVAQLGERLAGSEKVRGSTPLSSTECHMTSRLNFSISAIGLDAQGHAAFGVMGFSSTHDLAVVTCIDLAIREGHRPMTRDTIRWSRFRFRKIGAEVGEYIAEFPVTH